MFFSFLKILPFALVASSLFSIDVQLQEPSYSDGILKTSKGGVITAPGIRIQAERIEYIRERESEPDNQKEEMHGTVWAEGNLLIEYKGQFLVGSKIVYDFTTRTGTLWKGRTVDGIWFLGGEQVDLKEDGSLFLHNAFLTTSEGQENIWELRAETITVSPTGQIDSSNNRLNFANIPVFWIPSFKTGPGFVSDSPIRYRVTWDAGLGPRATVRYRVLSYENFDLYGRLDYRLSKGLGAALESDYTSKDKNTIFITKSYAAHDKVVYDETTMHRYRLQGFFSHVSLDNKTHTKLTYDKFSDLKMISDFADNDFEVNTQKRTQFLLTHQENTFFSTLTVEPRLNSFESINQKLPEAKIGIKTFPLDHSGILVENSFYGSFLDYVYANDLTPSHPGLRAVHAGRLESRNKIFRPFTLTPLHFTPYLGITALFYSNNPYNHSIGQGTILYGGNLHASFYRDYLSFRHTVQPYLEYEGLSKPKAGLSQHYTFTLDDGLYTINSLKIGLRNIWPCVSLDLYTYGFFFTHTFDKTFPKVYLQGSWSKPSYRVEGHACWNIEESLVDFCNALAEITINEDVAFVLEMRHRSRFDWRKSDHENFLLDMARPIDALLDTSLSDGRNTFLQKLQIRLSPKWSCRLSSHYGWGRANEPAYCSFKLDALALITSKWQCLFSFTHTTNDERFTIQMQLAK